jgi:hypothetical protein
MLRGGIAEFGRFQKEIKSFFELCGGGGRCKERLTLCEKAICLGCRIWQSTTATLSV